MNPKLKKKLLRHSWWALPIYAIIAAIVSEYGWDQNLEIGVIILSIVAVGLEIQSFIESRKTKEKKHTWKAGESKQIPKKEEKD